MVDREQFKKWCDSGFKEFAGSRRDAVAYGMSVGLLDYDVAVIRKIAGLSSHEARPYKTTPEMRNRIRNGRNEGKTMRQLAEEFHLSPSIIHRIVHKEERQ